MTAPRRGCHWVLGQVLLGRGATSRTARGRYDAARSACEHGASGVGVARLREPTPIFADAARGVASVHPRR